MKIFLITVFLITVGTAFTHSQENQQCADEMSVYGKQQTITANLLNYLSDPGKMREVTDYYGEQTQIANALIKEGKYQEACDIYQGVIDKYEMKTIEEQYYEKHPEKRPENKKAEAPEPAASASSAEDAASVSGEATAAPYPE